MGAGLPRFARNDRRAGVTWGWHWGVMGVFGGVHGFGAVDLGGFCGMMLRGHFVDAEFLAVCTRY